MFIKWNAFFHFQTYQWMLSIFQVSSNNKMKWFCSSGLPVLFVFWWLLLVSHLFQDASSGWVIFCSVICDGVKLFVKRVFWKFLDCWDITYHKHTMLGSEMDVDQVPSLWRNSAVQFECSEPRGLVKINLIANAAIKKSQKDSCHMTI